MTYKTYLKYEDTIQLKLKLEEKIHQANSGHTENEITISIRHIVLKKIFKKGKGAFHKDKSNTS